ncbi:MAG: metallophosphoesterase [Flavobacteriaceae bacterium]
MEEIKFQINRRTFLTTAALGSVGLSLSGMPPLSSEAPLRFGLVTDSHYADRKPNNTRHYRESLGKMREFIQIMNREKVDFIIHIGDFKDEDPEQRSEDTLRYLQDMELVYGEFSGPRYHCLGNHDVDSITKQQFLAHIENTGIATDKSYYSFDTKGWHIIVLDANYHADGRDQFYKEGADWQDPNIPDFELKWLKSDLDQHRRPTLIFCHHPLFNYKPGEVNHTVHQYKAVQKLLEEHGQVQAVFQGHVHDEHHEVINEIHYLTQMAMVDYSGLQNNSFAIVEAVGNKIEVIGFKRVNSRTM